MKVLVIPATWTVLIILVQMAQYFIPSPLLQFMKPIYQRFIHKSLEQAAISAAASAAASSMAAGNSTVTNGKMKSSWLHAPVDSL